MDKFVNKKILIIILLIIIFSDISICQKINELKYARSYIYIPGNETIDPFFISKYEVCNKDYLTYIQYLRSIYIDYPEVAENAMPDTTLLSNYFENPEYKYYPVIGVSWQQAYNYCRWLSDIYNEYTLIKIKFLLEDPYQINDSKFTTESFIFDQYEGLIGFKLPTLDPEYVIPHPGLADGIYENSFRLPTEAEWLLVNKLIQENPDFFNNKTNYKKDYTKNYFLSYPYKYFIEDYCSYCIDKPYQYYHLGQDIEISDIPLHHTGISQSKTTIVHFHDNISEWVYDIFENGPVIDNVENIYSLYGQSHIIPDSSELIDSLGYMPFSILKQDKNGGYIFVKSKPFYSDDNYRVYRGGNYEEKDPIYRGKAKESTQSKIIGFRPVISARFY